MGKNGLEGLGRGAVLRLSGYSCGEVLWLLWRPARPGAQRQSQPFPTKRVVGMVPGAWYQARSWFGGVLVFMRFLGAGAVRPLVM